MSAVESWFAPAAVAEPLPRQQPRRRPPGAPAARSKAKRRPRHSFRVRLPLAWMVVFALLLAGVVAVNVAVLRANVSVNNLDKKIAKLQQVNANLASKYSSAMSVPRVQRAARRAGLVSAPTPIPIDMGGDMGGRK